MSRQELESKISKLEDRLWWLNMADRFTPEEYSEWRRLNSELKELKEKLKEV